ncbi:MAG: hypothetical protein M3Y42_18650, partial [Actinomycetota bacterium]|nr:hypothetical protein [Actinomycetota bacterium]
YDRYRGPAGEPALDPARYQVSLLTPARLAGQARPGECAEVLGIDVLDRDLRESMIRLLHESHPFEQLLVFTERLLVPSARLREQLGIAGPTLEQVQPLRDKAAMKRAVAAAGLPMGDWAEAGDRTAALALLRKHGHVIIKPVDGTGSVGLRECRSERELADFWQAEPAFHGLVEEFLTDEMLHVDAVLSRGELVSCSVSRYLSSTMSYLSRQPLLSVMIDDERLRDRAAEFCLAASAALGVRDSVVHLELFHRPNDGRLLFCEMAGRAGGAGVGAAVHAVTGFNLYQAMVDCALGQRPVAGGQPMFPAAGWLLIYGEDGVLRDFDDSAVPREWLIDRSISAQPGQSFSIPIAGASLAKYVVGGADEAEVTQRMHRVIELCKLDYSAARTTP